MSHYSIEELIARWRKEELTVEQVIGQILLQLKELDRRQREVARPSADNVPTGKEQRAR